MTLELLLRNLGMYCAQIAVLIGAASLLLWLTRVESPRALLTFRHGLLAICLMLPLLQTWHVPVLEGTVEISQSAVVPVATPVPTALHIPWLTMLAVVLAGGGMIRLLWLATGIVRLSRYRRRARAFDAGTWIFLSDDVNGPVTFGWLKPVILLPSTFPALPEEMREAIIRHELAHVERHDWLFTLGEEIVRSLLWFHPAIWWLLAQIHLAREQAVDQSVVAQTKSREQYVEALLAMAGVAAEQFATPAPLFLKKRQLARRVALLVKENRMSKNRVVMTLAAAAAMLVPGARFGMLLFPLEAPAQEVKRGGENLLHRAPIEYPVSALENKIEGTVVVEARLDAKGVVRDARVISGPDELRAAALKSVLDWHYSTEKGTPPLVEVAIDFKLPKARPTDPVAPAAAGSLKAISMVKVPEELKEKILGKIGLRVGDPVPTDAHARIKAAIESVDEHLRATIFGKDGIVIMVNMTSPTTVPATASTSAPQVIRVGGNVQQVNLISKIAPVYPQMAKLAKVQGVVRMKVIIAKDGTVKNLELESGHPLLVETAMEAVRQWVYRPTLLNGNPVEVQTTVDVNFTLSDSPAPPPAQP